MFVEIIVQESVDRISQFFSKQGVDIGPPITFTYTGKPCDISPNILAQAPKGLTKLRTITEDLTVKLNLCPLQEWYQANGAEISKGALEQSIRTKLERLRRFTHTTDGHIKSLEAYGTDMIIYKGLIDELEANEPRHRQKIIDSFLAHEMWHVVEERRGLSDIMLEGSAEFARTYFESRLAKGSGYVCTKEKEDPAHLKQSMGDMVSMLYQRGLEVAEKHCNTLKDLFDPTKRKLMVCELEQAFAARISRNSSEDHVPNYEIKGAESRVLFPELNLLDQGLTKKNLLEAYTQIGFEKIGEELANQDCSPFLATYAKMGYGPKMISEL